MAVVGNPHRSIQDGNVQHGGHWCGFRAWKRCRRSATYTVVHREAPCDARGSAVLRYPQSPATLEARQYSVNADTSAYTEHLRAKAVCSRMYVRY